MFCFRFWSFRRNDNDRWEFGSPEELFEVMMNTTQLEIICGELDRKIKPFFRGCFALNNFLSLSDDYLNPNALNLCIVNSQPSSMPGKHWLLVANERGRPTYFFDSFAKTPEFYSPRLAEFLGPNTIRPPFRVQGDSRSCGIYCVFAGRVLAEGRNLSMVLSNQFSAIQLNENDSSVLQWFSEQKPYGKLLKSTCPSDVENCLSYEELLGKDGTLRKD